MLGTLLQRSGGQNMLARMRSAAVERFGRTISDKELSALVNTTRNALKHANDPSENCFDYNASHAVGMLFRAMVNYQLLAGGLTPVMEDALAKMRTQHLAISRGDLSRP